MAEFEELVFFLVGLHAHFESGNNLFGMFLLDIYILSYISEGCVVVVVVL